MARLGLRVVYLAIAASSAAVVGSSLQIFSAPRLATGTLARTGTTSWVSGLLGRLRPKAGARATTGPLARRILDHAHQQLPQAKHRADVEDLPGAYERGLRTHEDPRAERVNRPTSLARRQRCQLDGRPLFVSALGEDELAAIYALSRRGAAC